MIKRKSPQISPSPSSTQSGFTIIEALLAIIVVTVLMVGIAPVIALSVATRVQARRVELATQAARTYINGVRAGQIPAPADRKALNQVIDSPNRNDREDFAQVNPPPSNALATPCPVNNPNSPAYPYCTNTPLVSLYCVDLDSDSKCTNKSPKDMIVQAFRSATPPIITDDGSGGYLLGIRVYRADGFDGAGTFQTTLDRGGNKVATYTGGGGTRYSPLVEMTTEIRGSETNFGELCARLGGCPR